MAMGLTRRQSDCLEVIRAAIARDGFAPSIKEIGNALHLKSNASVHRLLDGLEDRGAIKRVKFRSRAIMIIERSTVCQHCGMATSVSA